MTFSRLMVSALYYSPGTLEQYEKKSTMGQVLATVINGLVAALLTIPATVFLDRMFMKAQRVTNSHEPNGQESEIAKLAKKLAL